MKAIQSLLKAGIFDRIKAGVAAGTSDVTSDAIDMQDCEGVTIIVLLGAVTATGVPSVKAQQSSDNAGSDAYADLLGTKITGDDTMSDKMLVLDIYRPRERYVKAVVGRATANVVVDGILAIKYGVRKQPVTQPADVAGSELHVSPAEGTA